MLSKRIWVALSAVEKSLYARRLIDPDRLVLPSFLGIGAQKAGSNWLVHNLLHHPELYVIDEPHYFDRHFHEPLRNYSKRFVAARDKICGDVTPAYGIMRRERIRFVRKIRPGMKVIMILRHPVDRAWSQARMDLGRLMGRNLSEVTEEEFRAHFQRPGSRRRSDYCSILTNWMEWFPAEQFLIEMYSTLCNAPQKLLQSVFAFLGVGTRVVWDDFPYAAVVNKGQEMVIPEQLRSMLEEMYHGQCIELERRFGIRFD